jgi:6-phosphogluconate dehydrogenase
MLPAGEPTEVLLAEVSRLLGKDDILIDAGNSYFKDTERDTRNLEIKAFVFWVWE